MNPEDVATGGGGGILGAFLAWLGFKSKIDSIDHKLDRLYQEVQFKDTCAATHKPIENQLQRIEEKLDKALFKP